MILKNKRVYALSLIIFKNKSKKKNNHDN